MGEELENCRLAASSDQKMKVFDYPLRDDSNYIKFKKILDSNAKEVLEHFEKLPVESGTLSVFYFDIETEQTSPIYEIKFNY